MARALIEQLNATMQAAGITKKQLADELGVTQATVYSWFSDRRSIPAERLSDIESFLGLDLQQHYQPDDEPLLDPRIARLIELAKGAGEQRREADGYDGSIVENEDRKTNGRKALSCVIQRAIANARQTHGLTQTEIANKIGVSPPQLTQWVRGYRPIPDERLLDLAKVLGLDFRREFIRYFGGGPDDISEEDRELARLIVDLNQDAKVPLLRLLKRLHAQ